MEKIQKQRGKTSYKALYCIILAVVMLNLITIPLISAINLDNSKSFDKNIGNYGKVKIKNLFGLGATIIELELKTNTDKCGESCSAETEIILYDDGVLIDNVKFLTLQEDGSWNEQRIRSYQFYIKNKSKWDEYELGDEVEAGTYTIKLEGRKKPSRTVDWQITSQGKLIDEWALWGGSGTVGVWDLIFSNSDFEIGDTTDWTLTTTAGSGITVSSASPSGIAKQGTYFLNSHPGGDGDTGTAKSIDFTITGDIRGNFADGLGGQDNVKAGLDVGCDGSYDFNFTNGNNIVLSTDSNKTLVGCMRMFDSATGGGGWGELDNLTMYNNLSTITLNSPTDLEISTTNEVEFNATATVTGGATLVNMSLWHNGTGTWHRNQTALSRDLVNLTLIADGDLTSWDEFDDDSIDTAKWDCSGSATVDCVEEDSILKLKTGGSGPSTERTLTSDNDIFTEMGNSIRIRYVRTDTATGEDFKYAYMGLTDGTNQENLSVGISTMDDEYDIVKEGNMVYWRDTDDTAWTSVDVSAWSSVKLRMTMKSGSVAGGEQSIGWNWTRYEPMTSLNASLTSTITDPTLWTYEACDSDGDCGFASSNRTILVDTDAPSITINSPTSIMDYGISGGNEILNWTVTDTNLDSCWYNYNQGQGYVAYNFDTLDATATVDDIFGNADGTRDGASNTTGIVGSGLDFSGTNQFMTIPEDTFDADQEDWTINVWISPDGANADTIVDLRQDMEVAITTTADPEIDIYIEGVLFEPTPKIPYNHGASAWNMVTITKIGTNFSFYKNGTYFGSSTHTLTDTNQARNSLGERYDGSQDYDGQVDLFTYYKHALTPERITGLYNSGAGKLIEISEIVDINITVTCSDNTTTFTPTSQKNLTFYAEDSVGNVNSTLVEWDYKIFANSETYNTTTYETASETYSINVTANSSLTAADLIFDGTSYAATQSGNVWSKTIDIPIVDLVEQTHDITMASTSSETGDAGIRFTPLVDAYLVSVDKISTTTGATRLLLLNEGGSDIATATFVGHTATLSTPYLLTAGTVYYITVDDDGGSYTMVYNSAVSYPITKSILNFTGGLKQDGTDIDDHIYNVESLDVRPSKYFNWSFTYAGDTINSNTNNLNIQGTDFTLCGGLGGSVPFLNFTFKDESDDSAIQNGTIPSSSFNYWLGSGSVNKTTTLINNTGNPSYAFCSTPADRNITVDYSIQYEDQEGDYIQRLLNPDALSFSNTTTDTILYLLKATDGIYVTFQVINNAEQPINGVVVTGTRVIDTVTTTVASGTTDSAGAVTFFLDSDFEHTFLFEKTGFDDFTTNLYPTQSSYTITLGTGTVTTLVEDYSKGIDVKIKPNLRQLTTDETYNFNLTLTSSFNTVTEFGFILVNSSGDNVASSSLSANGGTTGVDYNVGNTTSYISMEYYWVINGNYTNRTDPWPVVSGGGTNYSVSNFFTDFKEYFGEEDEVGIFGMGKFGRAIIVFLIIFMFVGIMSYKYGLVSPAGVSTLAFGLVMFFDVGVGIVPNPVGAVPNFPTIIMGIIMVGILFREVWR